MPVESKEDLITALIAAAKRMNEVREAASKLRLIRQGDEPNPLPLNISLGQPAPVFSGQPERSDLP